MTITNVSRADRRSSGSARSPGPTSGHTRRTARSRFERSLFLRLPTDRRAHGGPISYNVSFGYTGAVRGVRHVGSWRRRPRRRHDPGRSDERRVHDSASPSTSRCRYGRPAGTTYARFQLFDGPTSDQHGHRPLRVQRGRRPVGSSGRSTSDELINLPNPAAGTYTRGRSAAAQCRPQDASFTLHHWVLGSTAAGNMSVSAPTSATIGTTGAINLTFSGLAAATKYLGSVAVHRCPGLADPDDRARQHAIALDAFRSTDGGPGKPGPPSSPQE